MEIDFKEAELRLIYSTGATYKILKALAPRVAKFKGRIVIKEGDIYTGKALVLMGIELNKMVRSGYIIPETDYDPKDLIDIDIIKQYLPEEEIDKKSNVSTDLDKGLERAKQFSNILKINNFLDNVKMFWEKQPFFYDKQKIFWMWNFSLNKWEIVDEIDMMNMIEEALGFDGATVTNSIKNSYIECFKRVGRKYYPKDAPKKWIQFKDKAFSLKSGNVYNVKPNYFFCNPIPWEIGETEDTPVMDKLFTEWVGKENIQHLYEIIAYCCYADYPIQRVFCFYGNGRNGKSCLLKILSNFVGMHNLCSTDLDMLTGNNSSRFEAFKLYKKLLCMMGETNFNIMSKSSTLKKLSGGDLISYEKKGKDPFDDYNFAKIIIASNSLPMSEDTSDGYWRRWDILDFPNEFPEGKDVVATIPKQEYRNLSKKVCRILPELLKRGSFTGEGTIKERKAKYISCSNPIAEFLERLTVDEVLNCVKYNDLFKAYTSFLRKKKRRTISRREFNEILALEGLFTTRSNRKNEEGEYETTLWVDNIRLKEDWEALC